MASPMIEGRSLNPREKAHFSLHISDRITDNDPSLGSFSSIKYNHKPRQNASSRTSTLKAISADRYALTLQDKDGDQKGSRSTFTGQKQAAKRSYVLLFDSTSQRATLEPLSSVYTFNLSTENGKSATYTKIYPKKQKDDPSQSTEDDLFSDEDKGDGEDDDPDADNPFDFRHFLSKDARDRGNESPFASASSPDYRTGTGSAANTPLMAAKRPAPAPAAAKPRPAPPAARKRKSPDVDPMVKRKPAAKKAQATPTVRLDRRASTIPKTETAPASKPGRKPGPKAAAAASKIKSAEIVHSSDESDIEMDGVGEAASSPPAPPAQPSPEPARYQPSDNDDEDDDEDMGDGGLEIEVPDARPTKPRHNALASLGLGQSIGLGGLNHLKSPSNGPISLASAANSAEGSPNPTFTPRKASRTKAIEEDDVIDFGDMGGGGHDSDDEMGDRYDDGDGDDEVEDRDVEPMYIGSPAQQANSSAAPPSRKMSVGGMAPAPAAAEEEEEDDPLYQQMMEGLIGESSEESEEE